MIPHLSEELRENLKKSAQILAWLAKKPEKGVILLDSHESLTRVVIVFDPILCYLFKKGGVYE